MKSKKLSILYWVFTVFLTIIMGTAGVILLFRLDGSIKVVHHLGYPIYFTTLMGLTRLGGVAAVLLPVPKTLREWAYAGLTFDLLVTIFSILASGLRAANIIQPMIVLVIVLGSYSCWRKRCIHAGPSSKKHIVAS